MENGSPLFTALDFTGRNVIVNGKVLYVTDIKSFVVSIVQELQDCLLHNLFFGITDLVNIERWSPGVVNEEPRNTRAGYSCFTDPLNSFISDSDLLLRTVLDHPRVSGRFHFVDQNGQLVWKAAPCFEYLEHCEAFEMLLFSGAQVSVGEPARGTEFASHCLRNIAAGSIRNVFIIFQYFCFMGTFNKSAQYQGSKIMRVPHPKIGRIWALYLTHVRPLVAVWQSYFNGPKATKRAENSLFFGLHRPVTSSQLSRSLAQHTSRILDIRITISSWRHIATWFLNHHAVKFQEHLAMVNRATLAVQMGHGETTHNLYAGDARLPSGIDFHVFFRSMKTSGIWHELLGFPPTLSKDMNTTSSHRSIQDPPSPPPVGKQLATITPTSMVSTLEDIKTSLLPDLLRLINQTRANDIATLLSSIGIKPHPTASTYDGRDIIASPSRLSDLRNFLNNPDARFKTSQQAEVSEAIAVGEPSLLVIGPTGLFSCLAIPFLKPDFTISQALGRHYQLCST